ncbi:MAG: transposase family protein [Halanaerobiales bacterium]|nr:transposase family protein [Halanaerobiales bacterium]
MKIKKHFFKDINSKLRNVKDRRHQSYIEYGTDILLFTMIMKNVTGIESMNKMTSNFNKDECIENIAKALGYDCLEELPHHDTIINFLKTLEPKELENIISYMINTLFRKQSLEHYRLLNKYWTIAIDGTGVFTFDEKHCEHCLKKEYRNKEKIPMSSNLFIGR